MAIQKVGFGQSIRTKMLVFATLTITALLAVVGGYSAYNMYTHLRRDNERIIRMEALLAAREVDEDTRDAITVVKTMAMAEESTLFGKRPESKAFARRVLEAFPQFTGAYFGYEPNADQNDAEYLKSVGDQKEGLDANGRFLPYWFRDHVDNETIRINPLIDMETSLYYDGCKKKFNSDSKEKHMVTEPYFYEGKMMVEQTYPIVRDGQFVGIAGVDRALLDLDRRIAQFKQTWSVDLIVVSRMGKIVSATMEPKLKTKTIDETPYKDILQGFRELQQHPTADVREEIRVDPLDGERYYFVAAPVRTGNWLVVVRVSEERVLGPIRDTVSRIVAISVGGLALTLLFVGFMQKRVINRVREAVGVACQVAEGDLRCDIVVRSRDETGQLLDAVRSMTQSLASIVNEVKRCSVQLNSTARQLAATAGQQEIMVTTFGESTSAITTTVTQISATSEELATTINEVTQRAGETASLAESGRSGLESMEATMRQLADATGVICEKLAVINDRGEAIGQVVTTITKVADQTNLLSVNAAIEAKKAGAAGRGFLVVAQEIRRLADQTAVATLDIEEMVKEMQSSVQSGVKEVDAFSSTVKSGVEAVERVSDQLEQIIEQVQALTSRFDLVNEGMRSQAIGAHQIRESMVQLNSNASQTIVSLRDFDDANADLHEAVATLRSVVSRFHLRD